MRFYEIYETEQISKLVQKYFVLFVVNAVCLFPYFLGDMDKQHTEDAKDSESNRVLSLDEKEIYYKGV